MMQCVLNDILLKDKCQIDEYEYWAYSRGKFWMSNIKNINKKIEL